MNLELIRRSLTLSVVIVGSVMTPGCGESRPQTYPTRIKLQLTDGRPAVGARITLVSSDGVKSHGVGNGEGIAEMFTFQPGDGVVAGKQKAAIGPPAVEGDPDVNRPPYSIASRLASFSTSQIEFEVRPEKSVNEFKAVLPAK